MRCARWLYAQFDDWRYHRRLLRQWQAAQRLKQMVQREAPALHERGDYRSFLPTHYWAGAGGDYIPWPSRNVSLGELRHALLLRGRGDDAVTVANVRFHGLCRRGAGVPFERWDCINGWTHVRGVDVFDMANDDPQWVLGAVWDIRTWSPELALAALDCAYPESE